MANENPQHVDFFVAQTTNGVTAPIRVPILDVALFASGIFDGATMSLQVSPDELTEDPEDMAWFDHPGGIFTDATQDEKRFWNNADLAEVYIRAVVADAGGSTSLTFKMRPRVEFSI